MPREYGQLCPMARSLEILGERWTLLIVRDLLRGPKKFHDFASSLKTVAPGLLSRRLKLLEECGIITRQMYTQHPPRAEYALTDRGTELREIVAALTVWGAKHLPGERALVHKACAHPIEIAYRCAHCDEQLTPSDIELKTDASSRRRTAASRSNAAPARRRSRQRTLAATSVD